MSDRDRSRSFWMWTWLLFLGGIDGFKLLEPLRELGARPFFLFYICAIIVALAKGHARINMGSINKIGVIIAYSLFGFALYGLSLPPFGEKTPVQQFLAHSLLFFIGFSPLWLRWRLPLDEEVVIKAAWTALLMHGAFIAIDWVALLTNGVRPFEDSFLGSIGRQFPTGLFSEPSYVAAYTSILLPVILYRAKLMVIFSVSVVAAFLFYLGDVRSFFVIYTFGFFSLILARWGPTWQVLITCAVTFSIVAIAASTLSLLSVEDSLSSAYRLGNTISYLSYSVDNNIILGEGFGSSHFLYPKLNFPYFIYLSDEFQKMLDGYGNRVPVFNLWVRLFVEIGFLPTILLFFWILRRYLSKRLSTVVKLYAIPTFIFCFSVDSYIYGMVTIGLMLLFSFRTYPSPAPKQPVQTSARRQWLLTTKALKNKVERYVE